MKVTLLTLVAVGRDVGGCEGTLLSPGWGAVQICSGQGCRGFRGPCLAVGRACIPPGLLSCPCSLATGFLDRSPGWDASCRSQPCSRWPATGLSSVWQGRPARVGNGPSQCPQADVTDTLVACKRNLRLTSWRLQVLAGVWQGRLALGSTLLRPVTRLRPVVLRACAQDRCAAVAQPLEVATQLWPSCGEAAPLRPVPEVAGLCSASWWRTCVAAPGSAGPRPRWPVS